MKPKAPPLLGLKVFREQLGVDDDEYERICDFKSGVFNKAIKGINKHTDIKVIKTLSGSNLTYYQKAIHGKGLVETYIQQICLRLKV